MSSLKLQKLRISVKAYESSILDNACVKIVDAVKVFQSNRCGFAVVINYKRKFLGVITSSEIRKAILKKSFAEFELEFHKNLSLGDIEPI